MILGIDLGNKKTGLALAEKSLAEPMIVIRHSSYGELLDKLKKLISDKKIEKLVIGKTRNEYVAKLKKDLNLPIIEVDESMTTIEANRMSIEAGIGPKKRKHMEDAFSATLILQYYLDYLIN